MTGPERDDTVTRAPCGLVITRSRLYVPAAWMEAISAAEARVRALAERAINEAAAFAIRIDVAEELARLRSHFDEMARILKTGGEKVSALEIEETFREHPGIAECAVVGLDDPEWGQRVAIAVVANASGAEFTLAELRAWGRDRLSTPKIPSRLLLVEELPRNAMGKVVKTDVMVLFQATTDVAT